MLKRIWEKAIPYFATIALVSGTIDGIQKILHAIQWIFEHLF